MRAHVLIALLVMIMAGVLGVSRMELAVLVFVIGLVMVAEMLNTAVEVAVDLVTKEFHPLARRAKHVAAGGVLIAAVASVIVGYLIFFDRLASLAHGSLTRLAATPTTVTLAALVLVVLIAVLVKAGVTPFRIQGGLPSAHSSFAFALATAIYLLGSSPEVTLLALGIAALVGQARVEGKIHTPFEVVVGAALGVLVTLLTFQLLSR